MAEDKLIFCLLKQATKVNETEEVASTSAESSETLATDGTLLKPNKSLKSGASLPKIYRQKFPSNHFGLPLQEIDNFYADKKTFIVISRNWEIQRFSLEPSLGFLDVFNCVRWFAIKTIRHALFHYFMIFVMFSYTVYMYFISDTKESTQIYRHIFLAVFNLELNLKLIAYGAVRHPFSYFRSLWNWLDFVVILIMGSIVFIPYRIVALYAMETLRNMKWISLFPQAKSTFAAAFKGLIHLKDVIVFFLFVFTVSTIYALSSYYGSLRYRCVEDELRGMQRSQQWFLQVDEIALCGNSWGSRMCPTNSTCLPYGGKNPDHGYTNFDDFGYSSLSVLRLMTRNSWGDLYFYLRQVYGPTVILFLSNVVILGSFIFGNLFASHVAVQVSKYRKRLRGQKKRHVSLTEETVTDQPKIDEETQVQLLEVKDINQPCDLNEDTKTSGNETPISETVENESRYTQICQKCACCCPCFVKLQSQMARILFHRFFENFINGFIVILTIFMIFFYSHLSRNITVVYGMLVISCFYALEAILKIIALTPKRYFQDKYNVLDFVVAVEGVLNPFYMSSIAFRVIRILRLAKVFPRLGFVFKVSKTCVDMVFIVAWTLASFGRFMFGHPRVDHYNHIIQSESFVTVFGLFSGEWLQNLWDYLLGSSGNNWLIFIFFLIASIIGYILVTNLFLHLVMSCLETDDLLDTDHMINPPKSLAIVEQFKSFLFRDRRTPTSTPNNENSIHQTEETTAQEESEVPHEKVTMPNDGLSPCCCNWCCISFLRPNHSSTELTDQIKWQSIREKSYNWSTNRAWNCFITMFIFLSCVPFMFGLNDGPALTIVHSVTNWAVTVVFTLEIILNLLGQGCKVYFGDGWSRFDFINSVAHIIISIFFGNNAIRVLRLIPRFQRIRVVIEALRYRSTILNEIFGVCAVVWTIFALIGVNLFSGELEKCVDNNGVRVHVIFNKYDCELMNFTWTNAHFNFDTLMNSYNALFYMASTKKVIGTSDERLPRELGSATSIMSWFMLWCIFMGGFACLAYIVAAFIIKTNDQKKNLGGGYIDILMNDSQRKALSSKRKTLFTKPEKLITRVGAPPFIARAVQSVFFDILIVLLLIANTIALSLYSFGRHFALANVQLILLCLFVVEIGLKLLVFKKNYFKSAWNKYDFFVVIPAFINWLVSMKYGHEIVFSSNFFSILIVVRLVRWLKCVKRIFLMIEICNPAVLNVGMCLMIIMFFSSVTATQLYSHVQLPASVGSFKTVGSSFAVLSDLALGSNWDEIYHSLHSEGQFATMLFLNYVLIIYFVSIAAGTVIFMENYHRLQEKLRLRINDCHLENYVKTWQLFDPDATGSLTLDDLPDFLQLLDAPFQIITSNMEQIIDLGVPVTEDNRVIYGDVLQTIIYHLDPDHKTPRPVLTEEIIKPSSIYTALQMRQRLNAKKVSKYSEELQPEDEKHGSMDSQKTSTGD